VRETQSCSTTSKRGQRPLPYFFQLNDLLFIQPPSPVIGIFTAMMREWSAAEKPPHTTEYRADFAIARS